MLAKLDGRQGDLVKWDGYLAKIEAVGAMDLEHLKSIIREQILVAQFTDNAELEAELQGYLTRIETWQKLLRGEPLEVN